MKKKKKTKKWSSLTTDGTHNSHLSRSAVQKTLCKSHLMNQISMCPAGGRKDSQISQFTTSGTCCLRARYQSQGIRTIWHGEGTAGMIHTELTKQQAIGDNSVIHKLSNEKKKKKNFYNEK